MATRLVLRNRIRRSMRDLEEPRWTDDEINDAINWAVNDAWPSWFVVKQDTTNTVASNTFIYALPTDCYWAAQVWLEQDTDLPYRPIVSWRQMATTSATGTVTYSLYLDNAETYETGKTVKVIYEAIPPELANDTDNTVVPDDFIIAKAKSYLFEMLMNEGPAQDVDHAKTLMQWNQQLAEDVRTKRGRRHIISTVHVGGIATLDLLSMPGIVGKYRAV